MNSLCCQQWFDTLESSHKLHEKQTTNIYSSAHPHTLSSSKCLSWPLLLLFFTSKMQEERHRALLKTAKAEKFVARWWTWHLILQYSQGTGWSKNCKESLNALTCPAKSPHTPIIQRMLNTAEPTMVPTPTSPFVIKTPEKQVQEKLCKWEKLTFFT